MTEEGHNKPQDPMWVTMLECERVGPFHHSYGSKIIRVKDLGQGNLGVRAPSW